MRETDQDDPADLLFDCGLEKIVEVNGVCGRQETFRMRFEQHASEVDDAVCTFQRRHEALLVRQVATNDRCPRLVAKIGRHVALVDK